MSSPSTRNRLARETSAYLRQHAGNPVDWYAWGEEALAKARREQKPIFLSVGYSACHWCHVMERESFEDEATAALLNENFVSIKVDREERPDIDAVYMAAVQAMTRHGGWPMSVFLTPDLKPFYGGTYFPPEDRMGMPSFRKVLTGVASAWKNRREDVLASAEQFTAALQDLVEGSVSGGAGGKVDLSLVDNAVAAYRRAFDPLHGGFGGAPKFFHASDLKLALRHWRRTGSQDSLEMVTRTLDSLAAGGIYDHVGGGFHRYSTDRQWLVPHFEKMLYDNALLSQLYVEAFQATGEALYARIARETLDYVQREMTSPEGGFYSTQDADSEGEEGRFYVWTLGEIRELLGAEETGLFARIYGVTDTGNWEGKNILHLERPLAQWAERLEMDITRLERSLAKWRQTLFEARAKRVAPFRDEKMLVSWNGLMISAFAMASGALGEPAFLETARRAADFLAEKLVTENGGLFHCRAEGESRVPGFLDDYASLVLGLVALHQADLDPKWIERATQLTERMVKEFWDPKAGAFFYSGVSHESLIARSRDSQDGAVPSGTSLATTALLQVGRLAARDEWVRHAEKVLESHFTLMSQFPTVAGQLLVALDTRLGDPEEVGVAAPRRDDEDAQSFLAIARHSFLPQVVLGLRDETSAPSDERALPWMKGKRAEGGRATFYFCKGMSCDRPISDPAEALERLRASSGPHVAALRGRGK